MLNIDTKFLISLYEDIIVLFMDVLNYFYSFCLIQSYICIKKNNSLIMSKL